MGKERLGKTGYYVYVGNEFPVARDRVHGVQYINKEAGKALYVHFERGDRQKEWNHLTWTCAVTQKQFDKLGEYEYFETHEQLLASGYPLHPITYTKPALDGELV